MLSGQKRAREEAISVQNENISLSILCGILKPLELRNFVTDYLISIKTVEYETVDQRNALYIKPKCIIHLEDAPDGLPHLYMVDRTIKITNVIVNHLGTTFDSLRDSMGEEFCDHISSLERALYTRSAKNDIFETFFLPKVTLNKILGPTVLARLLNGKSPRQRLIGVTPLHRSQNSLYTPNDPFDIAPHSAAYCPTSFSPNIFQSSSSPAFAPTHSLPLETKDAQLAKRAWLNKQSNGVFLAINLGTPESHTILSTESESEMRGTHEDDVRECLCYRRSISCTNDDKYSNSNSNANANTNVNENDDHDLNTKLNNGIVFHREDISSIGSVIIQRHTATIAFDIRKILLGFSIVAKILARDYHALGKVHCDLTPTNILVLADTFLPIDSMNIPNGSIAPGGTLEWSAPEQILYQPVSDKTDVYSLGLIIVALLGGSMFGQISEYVVASKPQNMGIKEYSLDIVKLIPSPELTLGRYENEVDNTGLQLPIERMKDTLRRSLQFDSSIRPTILELADSLVDFAQSMSIGKECIRTLNHGFGDGQLQRWINDEGKEEYFWKSSYHKNNVLG